MFWGTDAVVDGWDKIRDKHVHAVSLKSNLLCIWLTDIVRQLTPPAGADGQRHLELLMANDLSITEFERRLADFLDKMLMGQSKPLLMQIESGRVEGLRPKDIKALFETIGLVVFTCKWFVSRYPIQYQ